MVYVLLYETLGFLRNNRFERFVIFVYWFYVFIFRSTTIDYLFKVSWRSHRCVSLPRTRFKNTSAVEATSFSLIVKYISHAFNYCTCKDVKCNQLIAQAIPCSCSLFFSLIIKKRLLHTTRGLDVVCSISFDRAS